MLINHQPLKHWIDNFYGYGSWNAPCWFIGYEETGGEIPEDVSDKINYFTTLKTQTEGTLCDIRELYKHVEFRSASSSAGTFNNLYEYRFGTNAKQDTVWKNLIAFVHGYQHAKTSDFLEYQQHHFLSTSTSNEALIQLYPLPGPNTHAWYYSWLDLPELGFLKSRRLYEEHVYQQRIQRILSNIGTYKPELVLMYGMENIKMLKESVQALFSGTKFTLMKEEKLTVPLHHIADINGTKLVITRQLPALKHQRAETGFDWEEFGKRV